MKKIRVVVFAWKVRDKPPLFGNMSTWDCVEKMRMTKPTDKNIIKELRTKIHPIHQVKDYKVVIYFGGRDLPLHKYYKYDKRKKDKFRLLNRPSK